ncbi:glycosyltransferase family 9 protein [Granulicella tundricola]|uniref:Glycosyl transferase family 9 n=1 Tax=Granulicella tundricola (strain ATCC BAA-1859 / DSM 23138 / MP5ACTX9) TaxID=1198114 RepID=E8X141_GRATM|nr:glycosyltransferase family 9 protein [Granulicella tundricola]ADW67907.1 glycosyl transferase family 9 [Granulicella tundricola MP5ACTX9]
MDRPKRVLVVRVGAMGDVLHGLPAVAALRERWPDCFIGWAIEPRWRALVEGGVADRVHLVPTREWKERPFSTATLRQIVELRREMRAERYDVCVDLQGSIRSAVIGRMSGAARFVGAAKPRERQARALYGERVSLRAEHVIGQACELMSAGVGVRIAQAKASLPVNAEAEEWFARTVGGEGFVVIAPTAGWGAKEWPAERFAIVAREFKARGLRVLVNSSGGDLARRVAEDGGAELVECGVAELVAVTRRAALVIGGDTGPVHLAGALGRPMVALFGPTDPARTGPYFVGAKVRVLRDAGSVVDHRRHEETEAGLMRVRVEEVVEAAFSLLETDHPEFSA